MCVCVCVWSVCVCVCVCGLCVCVRASRRERGTDRQTEGRTDRQTDKQRYRERDRQRNAEMKTNRSRPSNLAASSFPMPVLFLFGFPPQRDHETIPEDGIDHTFTRVPYSYP